MVLPIEQSQAAQGEGYYVAVRRETDDDVAYCYLVGPFMSRETAESHQFMAALLWAMSHETVEGDVIGVARAVVNRAGHGCLNNQMGLSW